MDVDYSDHDYCSTAEPAALDLILDHTEDLSAKQEKQYKATKTNGRGGNKFGVEQFAAYDNDKKKVS